MVSESSPVHLVNQPGQGITSCGIQPKRIRHQRSPHGIGDLRLSGSTIAITDRGRQWIDSLFQPAIETFPGFFPQVPNKIRRHDRLYVCRQTSAPRIHVEAFVCEMYLYSDVHEVGEVGPILQIARAPIDLVDYHALGDTPTEKPEHLQKDRTPTLRRSFALFEGSRDPEIMLLCISDNRIALLFKRYPALALLSRRDPYVGEKTLLHFLFGELCFVEESTFRVILGSSVKVVKITELFIFKPLENTQEKFAISIEGVLHGALPIGWKIGKKLGNCN